MIDIKLYDRNLSSPTLVEVLTELSAWIFNWIALVWLVDVTAASSNCPRAKIAPLSWVSVVTVLVILPFAWSSFRSG